MYLPCEIFKMQSKSDVVKCMVLLLPFRGKILEEYIRALHKLNAPCKTILNLCKLKTIVLTLKVQVEKTFHNHLTHKVLCSHCQACYVRKTDQHLLIQFRDFPEHLGNILDSYDNMFPLNLRTSMVAHDIHRHF